MSKLLLTLLAAFLLNAAVLSPVQAIIVEDDVVLIVEDEVIF